MILHLTAKERETVVRALAMYAEEYNIVSESLVSEYLRRGFRQDAHDANNIAGRAAALEETHTLETLNATILRLMQEGKKIDAIKYVRTHRAMGLKESKDYVEKVFEERQT
jgi:ribosomal protein L7/L12